MYSDFIFMAKRSWIWIYTSCFWKFFPVGYTPSVKPHVIWVFTGLCLYQSSRKAFAFCENAGQDETYVSWSGLDSL